MEQQRFSAHKLVLGLVLLAFGVLAFVDSTDLWSPGQWWRLWPVALIAVGLSSEIDAFRERRSGGGAILIAIGVWFLVSRRFPGLHELGLDRDTAFPLAVVVVGLFMTLHAVADRPAPQKKEQQHESR